MSWPETVRKEDLRIDYYRGSGKGGQKRNKTSSACRITHIPTGIYAQAEDERYQNRNKKLAFKRLVEKLVPLMKKINKTQEHNISKERIRSYNEPRQQVKDHRTNKDYSYNDILYGNGLEIILEDILKENKKCRKLT